MATSPETTSEARFMSLLDKWQKAEDQTIAHCQKMLEATDNILVRTMADLIKADSVKHKEILTMIGQAMEGAITLRPEELGTISELITEHLEIERSSISLAMEEFQNSRNFVVRQLLSYLLEDEKKHFKLLTQLNDYKRQLYPYA